MINKNFCMSSYLMYRYVYNDKISFFKDFIIKNVDINYKREKISNSNELYSFLKENINRETKEGRAALALSGGIDSMILASFMPKGSTCYTFKCVVPGKNVTDESIVAKQFARQLGLKHKTIEITFDDFKESLPILMKNKCAPIHSIECQIFKAAKQARQDGFETMIFGESADIIYGGMNGLLAQDWTYENFVNRYCYVLPFKVLREPQMPMKPFLEFENHGKIDAYKFINKYFLQEALGSYHNACNVAGIRFFSPFSLTLLGVEIDYERVRSGDSKYFVRECFKRIFPNIDIPQKIPMPRPVNEWFEKWSGPSHPYFVNNISDFSGDQKWMVWCLERFLNIFEEK